VVIDRRSARDRLETLRVVQRFHHLVTRYLSLGMIALDVLGVRRVPNDRALVHET
jgi:hypothetical protein